ncbi:histidine kinase [Kordia algicida OT-1]|uniref:Possible sensor protein n=1 Tax=Kordia algicida OT-1 TaxID=391587 RepID=A9DIH6_9FLAO|nr:histidine kinase [Kordia algicida]EDP97903.1 possible sensor protein [Kordia algicida OT-1]
MFRTVKHTFVFLLILIYTQIVSSQHPVANNLSDITNLPYNEFYDILEDSNNYIWLAANRGLLRYDGYNYTKFTNPSQKGKAVFGLKEDHTGTIWCNNLYGQLFYVKNDKLEVFLDLNHITDGQLATFEVSKDHIIIFTSAGVFKISKVTKEIQQLTSNPVITSCQFQDNFYFFPIHQIPALQTIEGTKERTVAEITSKSIIETPKIFKVNTKQLLLIYKNELNYVLNLFDVKNEQLISIKTPTELLKTTIYNVLTIDKKIWFCTVSGVFVYELIEDQLLLKNHLFKEESITNIIKDFNTNYWLTTIDNGVLVSPNLSIKTFELPSKASKITASCSLDKDRFVLGTNQGTLLFYDNFKLIDEVRLPSKIVIKLIQFDSFNDQLIISTSHAQSYEYDLKDQFIQNTHRKFAVAKSIQILDANRVFYGNYKEAIIYEKTRQRLLREKRVTTSYILPNQQLLIAFVDGLFLYDKNDNSTPILYNGEPVLVSEITATKSHVWILTQNNKVLLYDNGIIKDTQNFTNLEISTIKADQNTLWLAIDKGLVKFKTTTNALHFLTGQDGLDFSIKNIELLSDHVVLTTPQSFYTFPKNDQLIFKKYRTAKVHINGVTVNNIDTLVCDQYTFEYDTNKLKFDFHSVGYQANKHMTYQYRLKPIDTEWQAIERGNSFVTFNNLASNDYTFEIKAKNMAGTTFSEVATISFTITKPFWETFWFYVLCSIICIGIISFYFLQKFRKKERKRNSAVQKILMEKKIANLQLENFRSQMNPHFIFNALNSIQDYIISNEKELASSYLVKFSRLIRMYLEYSQQNEITLAKEIQALALYLQLEKVRFEDELNYKINVEKNLNTQQIKVPSLFIQPYIENALKHGLLHKKGERNLTILVQKEHEKLLIIVEDNGIGREKAKEITAQKKTHKPFATRANEERVHIYNTNLKYDINVVVEDVIENSKTTGTKVIIYIPLKFK